VLSLARRAHDDERLLGELVEKIRWFFRAARYPVPGPQELREMLIAHFRDEPSG
jgi:hypothetical protein